MHGHAERGRPRRGVCRRSAGVLAVLAGDQQLAGAGKARRLDAPVQSGGANYGKQAVARRD
jgi:hypothetical protein